jgi:hypothetical protein
MPIIEYVCPEPHCSETREKILSPQVDPETILICCPNCDTAMVPALPTRLAAHCYGAGIYKPSTRD